MTVPLLKFQCLLFILSSDFFFLPSYLNFKLMAIEIVLSVSTSSSEFQFKHPLSNYHLVSFNLLPQLNHHCTFIDSITFFLSFMPLLSSLPFFKPNLIIIHVQSLFFLPYTDLKSLSLLSVIPSQISMLRTMAST